MFHVKICGVRLQRDIDAVYDAGADAIGLNFFPKSIRFVDPVDPSTRKLSEVAAQLGLQRVGVFVNETPGAVVAIADAVGLDAVQLHGDETVEEFAALIEGDTPIIRAIKLPIGQLTIEMIKARSDGWSRAGAQLLLDADAGAAHGGSGKQLDWPTIRRWSQAEFGGSENGHAGNGATWILSGGLDPTNVAEAIRVTGAIRVDVASGVESPRGVKSPDRIRQFARQAAASIAEKASNPSKSERREGAKSPSQKRS